jgi:hypothetical protein
MDISIQMNGLYLPMFAPTTGGSGSKAHSMSRADTHSRKWDSALREWGSVCLRGRAMKVANIPADFLYQYF